MPSLYRGLTLAFLLLAPAAASAQPLQWFWWKTEPTRSDLALTADQSTRIEAVFQEGFAQLKTQKDELDRREGKLSRLIETMATEAEVTKQIDHVEAVRSALNKTRTLMLLHMRQVMTPDQRVKLNAALRDRREREQRQQRDADKNRGTPDGAKSPDGPRNRPN